MPGKNEVFQGRMGRLGADGWLGRKSTGRMLVVRCLLSRHEFLCLVDTGCEWTVISPWMGVEKALRKCLPLNLVDGHIGWQAK